MIAFIKFIIDGQHRNLKLNCAKLFLFAQNPNCWSGWPEAQHDRAWVAQQLAEEGGGLVAGLCRHHSERGSGKNGSPSTQGSPTVPRLG